MRLVILAVLSTVLAFPAGAASKRQQCRKACGAMIAACIQRAANAGFGNVTKGCKEAVFARCRREGPAVCGTFCGNGVVEGAEACDGADLRGATCASVGFTAGRLECTVVCGLDTSGCVAAVVSTTCGNGIRDGAEQCEGGDLGGATCTSLGFTRGGTLGCTAGCGYELSGCASQRFLATGQTTCRNSSGTPTTCAGSGHDGEFQRGAPLAYVDNGDGTVTDVNTGLMWEKLSDDGSIHDWDNTYTWADAFGTKIATLNAMRFAGHADWRVPNLNELESIRTLSVFDPSVSAAFDTACIGGCTVSICSCTRSDPYWSSSTNAIAPTSAWVVVFNVGTAGARPKEFPLAVRGVRGAS
jgi:hypothetical protein